MKVTADDKKDSVGKAGIAAAVEAGTSAELTRQILQEALKKNGKVNWEEAQAEVT